MLEFCGTAGQRLVRHMNDMIEEVPLRGSCSMSDPLAHHRQHEMFEPKIAFQNFLYVFAGQQFVEILQIRQTVKKEYALDQHVGCFISSIDSLYS
jgi:hypothetical protein